MFFLRFLNSIDCADIFRLIWALSYIAELRRSAIFIERNSTKDIKLRRSGIKTGLKNKKEYSRTTIPFYQGGAKLCYNLPAISFLYLLRIDFVIPKLAFVESTAR